MVDFLNWGGHSFVQAVFAQRVLRDVGGADASPAGTVTLVDLRIALVAAIALVLSLSVLGTESFVG